MASDSVKATNQTNQSNFAGTKTWAGGSSKIENFAGSCRTADMSKFNGPGKPSRHPEGVKGGNSEFPSGNYSR